MGKVLSSKKNSFQDIILKLQSFWANQGCAIIQPYDSEMGAGTFHPATALFTLAKQNWRAAYVQPCRRPTDGRYGENPNRSQHYYQFQVIIKPSPENAQELLLESLKQIGIDNKGNDIRFVEDNWEGPTLGASGLGWEVWCNGQEIVQFTYFQQLGGKECKPVPVELTYGLERCACVVQGIDNFLDLNWNGGTGDKKITYRDIFLENEKQFSGYNFKYSNPEKLLQDFTLAEKEAKNLLSVDHVLPAYEQVLKMSHTFNLIEARGMISVNERANYIAKVRHLARLCCEKYIETQSKL